MPATDGPDVITGDGQLRGGPGDDVLIGGAFADILMGEEGDDQLRGGAGNDTLDGGPGVDTADYSDAVIMITVDLRLSTPQGIDGLRGDSRTVYPNHLGTDTLIGIENVIGGDYAVGGSGDTLIGNNADNALFGMGGSDVLEGGLGNDLLDGGEGVDAVTYRYATAGVTIDLAITGLQQIGPGDADVLVSIENITGSDFADRISGNDQANHLNGGQGDDVLNGRGGDDTLAGGLGSDTAVFSGLRSQYTFANVGSALHDTIRVSGPDGVDTLFGVEFLQFSDVTLGLVRPLENPAYFMGAIRDFDGNNLGGASSWTFIGSVDVQGDGDLERVYANREIGRWATLGVDDFGFVDFSNHSWGGDTRVVGIYIDPLVEQGIVQQGSDHDSQRRFQNDLFIGNIKGILGAGDYDRDGLQEVYFSLTDGTAYLHAYMHADGNIRYANYQNQQQVIDFLSANGWASSTWDGWFG